MYAKKDVPKYFGISLLNLWLKREIVVFYGLQQLTACLNSQDQRRVHLRDWLACCWTGTWNVIGRTKKLCIYWKWYCLIHVTSQSICGVKKDGHWGLFNSISMSNLGAYGSER